MTKLARRKMQAKMKRAFKDAVRARKRLKRAVTAHKKLVKKYRQAA